MPQAVRPPQVRRSLWPAVAIGTVAVLGVGTTLAVSGVLTDEPTTTGTRTPATTAAEGGSTPDGDRAPTERPARPSYAVGITSVTLVDPSRPTAPRADELGSDSRELFLTIRYPVEGSPDAEEAENAPAVPRRFPLVLFVHGFNAWAAMYEHLLHDLARSGFVVVAPEFPLSSGLLAGPARRDDIVNQTLDLGFLITAFRDDAVTGLLEGRVSRGKVGIAGHSDGGRTVAAAAGNTCCTDPRFGAAAVLTGDEQGGDGEWFVAGVPPMLFVHGTDDETNPYGASLTLYADSPTPKYLVSILGAGHHEPFTTGPQQPYISAVIAEFFHAYLRDDDDARRRIEELANVEDVLELTAAEE